MKQRVRAMYIFIYIYTCIHVCTYIFSVFTFISKQCVRAMCMYVHTYSCTHTPTDATSLHIRIHTHTHSYMYLATEFATKASTNGYATHVDEIVCIYIFLYIYIDE